MTPCNTFLKYFEVSKPVSNSWVNFIRSDSDLSYFSGSDPDQFQLNPDPNSAYKLVGNVLGGIWMGGLPWLALVYCDLARARTLVHALRSK